MKDGLIRKLNKNIQTETWKEKEEILKVQSKHKIQLKHLTFLKLCPRRKREE